VKDQKVVQTVQDELIDLLDTISKFPDTYEKKAALAEAVRLGNDNNITLSAGTLDSIAFLRGKKSDKKPSELLAKLNARIEKFTGDPGSSYTWDAYLTQFKIAIANLNYDDSELRTIFLMSIEGDALNFFQSRVDEFLQMGWSNLLEAFAQRFDSKTRVGILSLMGMTQASNESVRTFVDRMRIAAKPLMPPAVPKNVTFYKSDGTGKEVENHLYEEQNRARIITVSTNEKFMVQFFTAGLRKEILQRLQTTDFPNLDAAAKAAFVAEDYLIAVGQYHSHHLKVNAILEPAANALQEMERRTRSRSQSKERKNQGNSGQCYNCQGYGHFARDCKRSKSQSRNGENPKKTQSNDLLAKLHMICQRLEKLEGSSKGKKKQRHQSKSPSRSVSRSRPRQKKGNHSRQHSSSRSQSRGSNYSSRNGSKGRPKN
jgi:hypothetical protein